MPTSVPPIVVDRDDVQIEMLAVLACQAYERSRKAGGDTQAATTRAAEAMRRYLEKIARKKR